MVVRLDIYIRSDYFGVKQLFTRSETGLPNLLGEQSLW